MRREVIVTLRLSRDEKEFLRRGASEMMRATGQRWDVTAMLRQGGLFAADLAADGLASVVADNKPLGGAQ